jgi:hypothetical protein
MDGGGTLAGWVSRVRMSDDLTLVRKKDGRSRGRTLEALQERAEEDADAGCGIVGPTPLEFVHHR